MLTRTRETPPSLGVRSAQRLLRYGIYPVCVLGSSALVIGLVGSGKSYWMVGPPIVLLMIGLAIGLERLLPHAESWQSGGGDVRTDVPHALSNVLINQASIGLYYAIGIVSNVGVSVWPTTLPFWAQFLIVLAILDFGLYGVHRISHHVPWLWRLHAIHHSSRRLYWLNGQRRHPLHEVLEGTPGLLVLALLGAPVNLIACFMAVVTIHLLFQHGNIDYRAGVLRHLFSVAELHRWHHQRLYAEVQGNYGAILAVWDTLFGTALPHRGQAPHDVGMDDEPDLPEDYLGQLRWPLGKRAPTDRRP